MNARDVPATLRSMIELTGEIRACLLWHPHNAQDMLDLLSETLAECVEAIDAQGAAHE